MRTKWSADSLAYVRSANIARADTARRSSLFSQQESKITITTYNPMNDYSRSAANANKKASKKSKGGKKDIPIFLQKASPYLL